MSDAGTRGDPGGVIDPAPSSAVGHPHAPTVSATLDRAQGHVGDVFHLTVTAIGARDRPVNLPSVLNLAPFEVLDRREEDKDLGDGRVRRTFFISIAAYDTGELQVPAVEVTYLEPGGRVATVRTSPLAVTIKSLLANEPEPQLKADTPPRPVMEKNPLPLYVAAGLGAAALGALVALLVRRRLRARTIFRPAPPPRPPHEIAMEKLDRLGASIADGVELRPLVFTLSEIVREYLGGRYHFDSLELTTDELVEELRRRAGRGLVLGEVAGYLAALDLVKFAKLSPSVTEARGHLEAAIRLVETTRARPEPPAAIPVPAGAAGP